MPAVHPSAPSVLVNRTRKRTKIIVAIDFGTTYSGIAYANTTEPDNQTVLKTWGKGTLTGDKVPTILRYDNGGITGSFKWGFQARRHLKPGDRVHEWFKLGLCPEYEERRVVESELVKKYPSTTALGSVKGDDVQKLVVDYLSSLKKHVDDHFQGLDAGVNELPREYIITVPAIWSHKEQERTRNCARKADMGRGSQLQIISEPEAAAIYALKSMQKIGLKVGDTFVICDAGGGTVDLTSYTISSLDPISLAGVGKGSGGLCGSSFLNRIFAKYLGRKMRSYSGGWTLESLEYAVEEFERRIKAEFTGEDDETYEIMMHGLSDSPQHGIQGGILTLRGEELRRHVFQEVMTKIQGLVRDQLADTNRDVKAILLAGGFGSSTYLKQQLELVQPVKAQRIPVQHITESTTAIVRGALIAGLLRHGKNQDGLFRTRVPQIESRIAGRSYGTRAYQPFKRNEDDESRKRPQPDGENLVERMQWFVKEGESIRDGVPKSFPFEKEREVVLGPIGDVHIQIYICEKRDTGGSVDPKYPDHPGVRELTNFVMDLKGLDVPIALRGNKKTYVASIDIEVTFDSASLSFCGVYGKGTASEKRVESKKVNFV